MSFGKKLVLFIITIISIILSCSRYYVIRNNFDYSIENSRKQNTKQHILEKYMLESNIVNSIQYGKDITNETIVEYLKNIYTNIGNDSEMVAVYTEEYEKIYSNIEKIEEINIKPLLSEETDNYALRKIGDEHYMLCSSHWNINGKIMYIVNAYDVENVYQERDRQIKDILIADAVILALSSIIISIFSFLVTNPIKTLNEASKKISSGKFDEKVDIKSKDEIGELANSFNIMAGQIENKINELNLSVKQKDDFINAFTHELKTPMTAIMGYADLLRLKKCDEELSQKALNYIYQEAKRLEELSFKLMKLMSLTNEKIKLKNINIKELINKIVKNKKFILKDIKIETNIEKYYVLGDIELLEVVIRNLVENAIKSEPKDSKVIIQGQVLSNKKYRVSVVDKGKGIPREHIKRVTEDFYMVDKSRSRTNGGSGIGLSLVKKILKLHNSDIFIESKENIGTTVYFDLEEGEDEKKNN